MLFIMLVVDFKVKFLKLFVASFMYAQQFMQKNICKYIFTLLIECDLFLSLYYDL